MSRPLVVSDCDEVLLRMVAHFRDWLDEEEGVAFDLAGGDFAQAMRWKEDGRPVEQEAMWRLLGGFFDTQMHRQDPIEGAVEAIGTLAEHADVVVLTNLNDARQASRIAQLADHGVSVPVYTNQGPKGPALKRIIEERGATRTYFIDDLAQHHGSAKETVGDAITTLHLCGEPSIAGHITCAHRAGHADARIDEWSAALPWLLDRLEQDRKDAA